MFVSLTISAESKFTLRAVTEGTGSAFCPGNIHSRGSACDSDSVVPKKNGKPRFWEDYRRLNSITKKDTCPIPRMDDCLDSLGEAQIFSTLDYTAGYWHVPLRADDR